MSTLTIRQKLHQFIDKIEEKKVEAIYIIFENEIELGGNISVEQYNKEIDEAMNDIKNGEVYSHEEVVEMSKKW